MNEIVRKCYRAEIKAVDENTGEVDLFIPLSSTEWDRDQEVVEPASIKKHLSKFMKHPALVASHDYRDLTNLIGEWTKIRITDTGVEGKPKYYINQGNEQADWGFNLVSKGMGAFSYGFIPKVWEDGDGVKTPRRTYKEIELLEISQVIVPSNREAIQNIRSKSVDPIVTAICDAVEKEIPDAVTKPEETDEYIRIPVDRGNHEGHRIRTIDISAKEGIKAIYCGECKKVMTYLFAKDHGWTMEKARAWVKEHSKEYIIGETTTTESDDIMIMAVKIPDIPQIYKEHKEGQESLIDEVDYLNTLIITEGISDKAKPAVWTLVKEIMRLPGDDIPVDIKSLFASKQEIQSTDATKIFTNQDILEAIKRVANQPR